MNERIVRCAIYTRKSIEEGLDQEFNSLDAQRTSAEAFVESHRMEGWTLLPTHYDDGGYSGGTLERPALKRLLGDVDAGLVDMVIVYKIDRLSRSIADFAALNERFERAGCSFASVTQEINTATSGGRMMLNILVTFAQYEREVITERIRDKFVQSRKAGFWTGGSTPYGYDLVDHRLVLNPERAEVVRLMFDRYADLKSARGVIEELEARGVKRPNGKPWSLGHVYKTLASPIYVGLLRCHGDLCPGRHEAVIDRETYERVQAILKENTVRRGGNRVSTGAMLSGLVYCGCCGTAMTPSYASHGSRRYLYYACSASRKKTTRGCEVRQIGAPELERIVTDEVGRLLRSEEFVSLVAAAGCDPEKARDTLSDIPAFLDTLFPVERNRLLASLVKRVDVRPTAIDITLNNLGATALTRELENPNENHHATA